MEYNIQYDIGKIKYLVNYHKGKKYKDGSKFFDIAIFKNKNKMKEFIKTLNKMVKMKYYKIKYLNGDYKIVKGKDSLEIIKKYDLASRDNANTQLIELSGEQEAIAISNEE